MHKTQGRRGETVSFTKKKKKPQGRGETVLFTKTQGRGETVSFREEEERQSVSFTKILERIHFLEGLDKQRRDW